MDLHLHDKVELKKAHPCGSREWEVLRRGADFRLKCKGCGHQIMIARKLLEKNIKEINMLQISNTLGINEAYIRRIYKEK